jgi:hypothetical protein
MSHGIQPRDELELAGVCAHLGAARVSGVSAVETALLGRAVAVDPSLVDAARHGIAAGRDPLGEWFSQLRTPLERRERGATYTPPAIVSAMVEWGATTGESIGRVIDPGAGSGRFLVAAARVLPAAQLVGIEIDPLAALMVRAHLAAAGVGDRAEVQLGDYRELRLPRHARATLFAGNPPYVRHHGIDRRWKAWLTERAAAHGLDASQLAGLHVHFFLATLQHARAGDCGVFITAAEWLDVNYGKLVRELLAGPLGLTRLDILDPRVSSFADAQTTSVITCFRVGSSSPVRVRRARNPAPLAGGKQVSRTTLAAARWSELGRPRRSRTDVVELGELCRVHRGQVTGANAVWIHGAAAPPLPDALLRATITRARELIAAGAALAHSDSLRRVVDLPADLDRLDPAARRAARAFLRWARTRDAHTSYIARHRSPWWAVKLRRPAPILATYMARRPPAFVRNLADARHLNIAHGLYPRDPLAHDTLDALARYLATSVSVSQGRTYAGGLTKFEPREMERLLVPLPEILEQLAAEAAPARRRASS